MNFQSVKSRFHEPNIVTEIVWELYKFYANNLLYTQQKYM